MSLDELAYVKHMLEEARYLEGATATLERHTFLADPTYSRPLFVAWRSLGRRRSTSPSPFVPATPPFSGGLWPACATA